MVVPCQATSNQNRVMKPGARDVRIVTHAHGVWRRLSHCSLLRLNFSFPKSPCSGSTHPCLCSSRVRTLAKNIANLTEIFRGFGRHCWENTLKQTRDIFFHFIRKLMIYYHSTIRHCSVLLLPMQLISLILVEQEASRAEVAILSHILEVPALNLVLSRITSSCDFRQSFSENPETVGSSYIYTYEINSKQLFNIILK
jgi:hypothetical protein